ncbi:MAG: peptidylprolyl isomerase [Clostridiaceae bacterium]
MENKAVAKVLDKVITEKDLVEAVNRFPADKQQYLHTEQGRKQLVDNLINFEIFYNYGKELNLDEDAEFIEQFETLKKEVLVQFTIQKVMNEATVTEAEAEEYFNANKQAFNSPEKVEAKHILVETEEEAAKVKKEIDGGLAFADAAMKYSMCPSNQAGGSLGAFGKGQMVPEFEEAAFTLPIGEVSEPVKTQFGYHLILVENKAESKEADYNDVKASIIQRLSEQRQRYRYLNKADELKEKYKVEQFDK